MKVKIWVLCTVLADENAPAMPAVFADEAEAWAKYDEMIRAEWDNLMEAERIWATPMKPKLGFAKLMAPNGAAGNSRGTTSKFQRQDSQQRASPRLPLRRCRYSSDVGPITFRPRG
jgi:hypothetical protein